MPKHWLHYIIIDAYTGRELLGVYAPTELGARSIFRRRYLLHHNYPYIVAVDAELDDYNDGWC